MKRVPALVLLLVLAPCAWSEDVVKKEEPVTPAESTVAAPSAASEASVVDASSTPPAEPAAAAPETTPPAVSPEEAASAPVPAAPAASSQTHKVVRGDTLWDLAGSYLKDPFLWPKILDANREKIQNPRLIYPDQEFVIPTLEAAENLAAAPVAAPEEPAAAPAPAPEPPAAKVEVEPSPEPDAAAEAPAQAEDMDAASAPSKKMIAPQEDVVAEAPEEVDDRVQDEQEAKKKKTMAVPGAGFMGGVADSFLADENWEYDGYILRDRDQRMMISQGDVVFLNIGAASGVKPKMVANIYRVGKKVKDPYLKKKAGRMVKRVGAAMVTGQITDEGCTAVVTNSLEPIRIGDIVKFSAK